jgi:DNA polymerase III epsilon subunit-like protein
MLADAQTFDVVAPQIWSLIENKTVVMYNADFGIDRLCTSIYAHYTRPPHRPSYAIEDEEAGKRLNWLRYELEQYCAMKWFAVVCGEKYEYYGTYTWQKLETVCSYFGIPFGDAHDAMMDARATAALVHKLAQLAERELPEGYHAL